ncbi:hypothetical protein Q5P01_000309 [Channa striata]|uniref:Uncharacterized protein n=1 Tax=Channa striata TaxID=64152 RepID=A0AA88IK59_CHASR|nr:hypothetical protein Q5P01_000309 [Channa striata]
MPCARFVPSATLRGPPERPRSPLAEPPPLPPPTQLSEAEKTHQRNSRLSRRGSESNGYHERAALCRAGLHDPQREPRSRAHTKFIEDLNSHLSQGSQENTSGDAHPADDNLSRRGLAEPAPGGETAKIQGLGSAGKSRITWFSRAGKLRITICRWTVKKPNARRPRRVRFSRQADVAKERRTCAHLTSTFFSRTSAVNRTPDTDVLQRAVEMYLPEGIPREVEEMYQEYHRPGRRTGRVGRRGARGRADSAPERSATPGPDPAELIEGGMPDDRPGPSRGDRDQQAEPLSDSDLGNEAQRARISRANRMRWKSRGLTKEEREASNRAPFHKMTYLVSKTSGLYASLLCAARPRASRLRESPQSRTANLDALASGMNRTRGSRRRGDIDLVSSGTRLPPLSGRGSGELIGQGRQQAKPDGLAGLATTPRVNCKTLSCRTAEQAYHTLNLSANPRGFRTRRSPSTACLACAGTTPQISSRCTLSKTNYLGACAPRRTLRA